MVWLAVINSRTGVQALWKKMMAMHRSTGRGRTLATRRAGEPDREMRHRAHTEIR